ncbi:alpha/beta fold hydrolase [Nocardioides nanhaiensis]|uniref:3-oxoadipate enol-lactonase n=1 Tax=Nocardioides nanhaiensis TaxID=1476871 RepID=A0ABP8WRN3_9ACTN
MPTLTRDDGATIAYHDTGAPAGRPDAPTVVLGHGLLFRGWMFHPQVEVLRERYRCVSVDWRGQGDSPPQPRGARGYDMDTLTGDAAALVSHLAVGPVHWVGLSMGGFVGMRLAARHPDLVRSLTLLNTSAARETRRALVEDLALAGVFRVAGIGPVRPAVEKIMFGPDFLASSRREAVVEEWLTGLARQPRSGVARAVVGVVTRRSVEPELSRITAPTLVVVGEHDQPTPPRRGAAIAAAVAGARLERLGGCGHSSTLEKPGEVTDLLTGFLGAH